MRRVSRLRRGVVLLEAIIALAILSVAGAGMLALATQSRVAVRIAREHDARVLAADEYLGRVSLWSAADLDRHLGERRQGPWSLRVSLSAPRLYLVELRDGTATGAPILATTLYRPDSAATNR